MCGVYNVSKLSVQSVNVNQETMSQNTSYTVANLMRSSVGWLAAINSAISYLSLSICVWAWAACSCPFYSVAILYKHMSTLALARPICFVYAMLQPRGWFERSSVGWPAAINSAIYRIYRCQFVHEPLVVAHSTRWRYLYKHICTA